MTDVKVSALAWSVWDAIVMQQYQGQAQVGNCRTYNPFEKND